MRAWPSPGPGSLPAGVRGPAVRVHDSSTGGVRETTPREDTARMDVCGLTPCDPTPRGPAPPYAAFDLRSRAWRSAGHGVRYVQNVTDVGDPLLERAEATGEDWQERAGRANEVL